MLPFPVNSHQIFDAAAAIVAAGHRPTIARVADRLGVDARLLARRVERDRRSVGALGRLTADPYRGAALPEPLPLGPWDLLPDGLYRRSTAA